MVDYRIQFIEKDPSLFEEVKAVLLECMDRLQITRCLPEDLEVGRFDFKTTELVLFDLDCGNCNSLKLFENLRNTITIPIVVMDDTQAGANRLIKALHFGASEYLLKPISKNHLISTIISHSGLSKLKTLGGQ